MFGQVIKALQSASRVFEYIHIVPSIPITGGEWPDDFKGDIEFKNVYFSYPTRPDYIVLEDYSLTIPSGSVTALCGQSGSGILNLNKENQQ